MAMKKTLLLIMAVGILAPTGAQAQRRTSCCKANPFSFSPYAGAWKDALDISEDDENTGYMVGFRVGYDLSRRSRLVGDIAYAESKDVANSAGRLNYNEYDNLWIMTTGGAEYDIIPGPTSVTLGAQAGVGWRKISLDETVGFPAPIDQSTGYTAHLLIAPRISVRHALSGRTALEVSIADNIFPDDSTVNHSPALTFGFSFR
jgi:hypothetical protein